MREPNDKGISLIELIIVIAIMSILIGVIAPQYLKYVERSKRVRDADTAVKIHDAFDRVLIDAEVSSSLFSGVSITESGVSGNYVAEWSPCKDLDPTGAHKSDPLISQVLNELGSDPESATFDKYVWVVELDHELGCVRRIELVNFSSGAPDIVNGRPGAYELWPDSSTFRSGGELEGTKIYR